MGLNDDNQLMEEIIKRDSLFYGKYLHLERLLVKLPDGRIGEREIVRVPDAVAVFPMDNDKNVYLVKQHRPAIELTLIEIPAGLLDESESPEDAAVRECEEETGYRPGKLKKLISYAHAEGYSTGFLTLYLGTELEHTGQIHLDSTEYVEQISWPFERLLKMVMENRIMDSKTILGTLIIEKLLFSQSI